MINFLVIGFMGSEGSSYVLSVLKNNFVEVSYGFEFFERNNFLNYNNGDFDKLLKFLFEGNEKKYNLKIKNMQLKPNIKLPQFPDKNIVSNCLFKIRRGYITPKTIKLFSKYNINFISLVREDLFKKTISSMENYLQFTKEKVERKKYDPILFKEKYNSNICFNKQAYDLQKIYKHKIFFYESLLKDPISFFSSICDEFKLEYSKEIKLTSNFKKVHPENLEKIIENYNELKQIEANILAKVKIIKFF